MQSRTLIMRITCFALASLCYCTTLYPAEIKLCSGKSITGTLKEGTNLKELQISVENGSVKTVSVKNVSSINGIPMKELLERASGIRYFSYFESYDKGHWKEENFDASHNYPDKTEHYLVHLERSFLKRDKSKPYKLYPDWKKRFHERVINNQAVMRDLRSGKAIGFNIGDELLWMGLPIDEFKTICDYVREKFPKHVIYANFALAPVARGVNIYKQSFNFTIPKSLSWASIDYYNQGKPDWVTTVRNKYQRKLYKLMHPHQKAVLVPGCFASSMNQDPIVSKQAWDMYRWAVEDERVVGIFPWGRSTWGGAIDLPKIPLSRAAYAAIGQRISNGTAAGDRLRYIIDPTSSSNASQPMAREDHYFGIANSTLKPETSILANDLAIQGNDLTANLVKKPETGQLTLQKNGLFAYKSANPGVASFTYSAVDKDGNTSSPTKVTLNIVATDGLLGYWSLDRYRGKTVSDQSSMAHHGTAANTRNVKGRFGNAVHFNGKDSAITISDAPHLSRNVGTISFWVRIQRASTGNGMMIINKHNSPGAVNGFSIFEYKGAIGAQIKASNSSVYNDFIGTQKLTPNRWHHAVFVYEAGSTSILYLDKVEQARVNRTLPMKISSSPLNIGHAESTWWDNLTGDIDEVRIYLKKLTATEVKKLQR
jgi:hypothetical protein